MAALRGQGAGKLSRYPTAPGGHSKTLAAAQGKPAALSSTVKITLQSSHVFLIALFCTVEFGDMGDAISRPWEARHSD